MTDSPNWNGGELSLSAEREIDEICDQFEREWAGGARPRLEDYLGQTTEPARTCLLYELLRVELDCRRNRGEAPAPEEYHPRLPGRGAVIASAFALTASWSASTVAVGTQPAHPLNERATGSTDGGSQPELALTAADEPVALPARAGRYLVEGVIAAGGVGVVLRAWDPGLNRALAVKVLRWRFQGHSAVAQRFVEEAQVLGQLQHPGVPPVYEVGTLDSGEPFLAMKLIRGNTLAELLRGSLPAEELPRFLGIFERVCQAVGYAHSRGVLHRDLKPGNIMVGAFGEVQVMDWGLAKVLGTEAPSAEEASVIATVRTGAEECTELGAVLGTYAYMAPEQARGEANLDARADVFGLGAVLCAILTGRPPYSGRNRAQVRSQAELANLAEAFARLEGCVADAELIALAKGCLAPDRADRPADGAAVAEAVAAYQTHVQERLRAAELEQAQARERLLGNAYAAQVAAGAVLLKWRLLSSAVEGASRAPELWEFLRNDNAGALQQFLEQLHARYENEPLFKTWYVLDREGGLAGYWPIVPTDGEVLGESYSGRDYFQGARQKRDSFPVHVSRIFRSVADGVYKVALSTPIRDLSQADAPLLGVIAVSLTTDPVMGLPQFHDRLRKTVLVGRQDTNDPRTPNLTGHAERKYLILVHPAYRGGQEPVAIKNTKLCGLLERERSPDEFQLWDAGHVGNPDDYRDEDYRDPVACQESSLSGPWLAGFAPVGNTEFAVIVQQR
jgi:tRNA A-37 threonylcarbamoyl transferase component Bud32